MTRVQSLASLQKPLAEVLIDALRAGNKPACKPHASSHDGIGHDQLDMRLDDEPEEIDDYDPPKPLRPDEAAAAILLGRALDHHRDALARLQDPDMIAVIEVPAPEYVGLVSRLIRLQIIGTDGPVLDDGSLAKDGTLAKPRTLMVFRREDDDKTKKRTNDNGDLAAAMQWRCAILGIAHDPDRLLPRDLVRLAERRIVLPALDASAVAAVIEAVTGRRPGSIDETLAHRVTLEALMIAVRADLGAERSLARLVHLLCNKGQNAEPAPMLSELHGLGAAKDWGLALAHDLADYAAGRLPWAAVDKGCLLTGLPGTGKTSFARALAREAGVFFLATSYAEWQAHKEGHLGHVTQAIRNVFAEAQKNSPAIIFIDEIDTIPARGGGSGNGNGNGKWNDAWFGAITTCLLEMLCGFESREGLVVIAACNSDPSSLDPALVRAGRLDRHIHIPLPDIPGLIGIFRTHLGHDLEGADLRTAALSARGHTGADVERWVRDARRKARVASRQLNLQDLLDAVRGGEPEWPVEVRRLVAYHEAAHTLAMVAVGIAEPKSLSIGGNGGLAESGPGEMRSLTRAHLEKYLIVLLAGRASEQLIFGEATAGAGGSEDSDLSRATKLATQIETAFGLGSYGLICVGGETTRDLLLFEHLRNAVNRSLEHAHAAALELLSTNRSTLDALAEALFTGSYLDRDEIEAILTKAPLHPDDDKTETPEVSVQQPDAEPGKPEISPATAPDSAIPASEVPSLPSS
jgi:hypothetical protein